MFLLKRKGDFRIQLTRTLKKPGRHRVELYLFTPHESTISSWTLAEDQFFFQTLNHSFGLLGLPSEDRASKKTDTAFSLLSPHYEIMFGSWLFQYQASLGRLSQQLQNAESADEVLSRALRLSQNFAQRIRKNEPKQSSQLRYFRQMDIYFSWHTEQFLLQHLASEQNPSVSPEVRQAITEFLAQEHKYRHEKKYLNEFHGSPTRIWNRMNLYHRLLEYPVMLRSKITALGAGTQKAVKAISTMLVMSLFTYFLFNIRGANETLSITLLLGIALIYAVRDLLRDDMISNVTRWLRKGKPRWKIRLLMPYTKKLMAQQWVWLNYRKLPDLAPLIRERSGKWASNEERQIICYRSELLFDKSALEKDEIRERITLDCEQLCAMIQASHNKLFVSNDEQNPLADIQAHPIEKQHDYNLLLVYSQPGQAHSSAQRWRLRLGSQGIVQCESKKTHWPDAPTTEANSNPKAPSS